MKLNLKHISIIIDYTRIILLFLFFSLYFKFSNLLNDCETFKQQRLVEVIFEIKLSGLVLTCSNIIFLNEISYWCGIWKLRVKDGFVFVVGILIPIQSVMILVEFISIVSSKINNQSFSIN